MEAEREASADEIRLSARYGSARKTRAR